MLRCLLRISTNSGVANAWLYCHGQEIAALSETDREKVIDWVWARLPAGPDGRITYSARANAIKALAPARFILVQELRICESA